jgi:hypothetical protein
MINSNLEQADGKSIVLIFMLFGIPRYTLISYRISVKDDDVSCNNYSYCVCYDYCEKNINR